MRELHNRYSLDNLEMALSEGMLRGHPAMPKFDFTQGEIDAIMSYLRSIQTNQSAARGASGGPPACFVASEESRRVRQEGCRSQR
jgi:hypothetical protein